MHRFLILSLFATTIALGEPETIDRSGAWDVNGPMGPSSTLEFSTDEGTWMSLDVHPDGGQIIFDLLGDLYVMPIEGGKATQLTQGAAMDFQPRFNSDGSQVLFASDRGSNRNAWLATFDGEKLSDFKVLSKQTDHLVNGGDWMAQGNWILARKRVTDTSSIGVSELWMYHRDGGKGVQLVADKGEVDSFSSSADGRYIYFGASGPFSYERNPHRGVWSVMRYDRHSGEKRSVTGGNGSAAAPALSPDGQSIAFVRRVGTQTTLWVHDLGDGSERQIWDGLDRDQIEGFGTHYIYPGYDWMPDGQSLIIWAGGKINRVAVDGSGASVIPFQADVSIRYREPLRSARNPAPDVVQAKLIRWPVISPDGNTLVFNAFGRLYYQSLPDGAPQRVTRDDDFEFAPAFSADGRKLAFTTWNDAKGGALRTVSMRRGRGFGRKVFQVAVADFALAPKAKPRDSGDHGIDVIQITISDDGLYLRGGDRHDLESIKSALESSWQMAAQVRVDVTLSDKAPFKAWSELKKWLGEAKVGVKQVGADKDDDEEESDTAFEPEIFDIDLSLPRAKPDGSFALTGARIITMDGDQIIENGTVVVVGNRIAAVGPSAEVTAPAGAQIFDVGGKTILPGLIDVHAHLGYASLDVNPQKDWQYYANLAYGVTTTHDPSASTHTVFSQSEMVAAGIMTGPRIFSTGFILYGALSPDRAIIDSYADALSHVRRLKSQGAFSVKSYEQPRRDQRQWIIRAAAAEDMLVVPEGGGDFPKNLGMVVDGHSGIEHAMSPGKLYKDVVSLFAKTRAGYTATLLVAYAGQSGEKWFYQHYKVWENEKLQSFFPPRSIDARSRRRSMSAEDDYNHKNVAGHLKAIDDAGGLITLGAHGQLQGLGAHWELWAMTHGGMQPHAALRAATINGAEYLGMDDHLGSITVGKLADLMVLDENPLEKIENTDSVNMTVINGVVYDADSMDQLWPEHVERGKFFFQH